MPVVEISRLSARGRPVAVPRYVAFQDLPLAGQRLRLSPDKWDRFLNRYQAELVGIYDAWATETQRLMTRAATSGATSMQVQAILTARSQDLQAHLTVLGRARIAQAGGMGLGRRMAARLESPGVRLAIAKLQASNDLFLSSSLIPDMVSRLSGLTVQGLDASVLGTQLEDAFVTLRPRVAGYSGGATVAIFETQKTAGSEWNQERQSRGEGPIPIRWVLDPMAEHCEDDPKRGTHGCPNLAGVYLGGWDELPTVPAGHVSCLGNCRCRLELSLDGGRTWERP